MNNFYLFQLGKFEYSVLHDGGRTMSIEEIFPTASNEALMQTIKEYGLVANVPVGMNLLHINTGTRRVLIDTGLGNGQLADSMAAAGISPADIDTVIITHSDGDHIGGISNFPNARFILPRHAWELWAGDASRPQMVDEWVRTLGIYLPEDTRAQRAAGRTLYGCETLPALRDRIDLVEPGAEFLPGFKLIAAPGHRSDHYAVEIKSGGETLLHVADAFRHQIQAFHPEWASRFDTYPEQTSTTVTKLFQHAADQNALVFCAHLEFPGLTRIRQLENAWAWESIVM